MGICIALFETFHYKHLSLKSIEGRHGSSRLNSQHSEAEAGGVLRVPAQPGLQSETFPKKKINKMKFKKSGAGM